MRTTAVRTPRRPRSPPRATRTCAARRCTCRSSRAATRARRPRARRRLPPRASRAWSSAPTIPPSTLPDSQLVMAAGEFPLTVLVSRAAPRAATGALIGKGAEVVVATGENEPARVRSALSQLGAQSITSILLEGGPHLAGAFLDADEIDELHLFLAPIVLGGRGARDAIEGEGRERIAEAVRALNLECESIDEDLLISARLKEW